MTAAAFPSLTEIGPRLSRSPLLLMLDIDGTLAPIAPRPEDASVPEATRRVVGMLAAQADVHVALVTGRAAADGRRLGGIAGVWVIGNHGIETVSPRGEVIIDDRATPYGAALAGAVRELTGLVSGLPGVHVENKTWTLSVHYRLADPAVEPDLRGTVDGVARARGLRVVRGKKVFELRPPVEVHKGTAALALARRLVGRELDAALFYAGDDRTDEDAFRTLRAAAPHVVTVRVGVPRPSEEHASGTAAEFVVADEAALRALLEWLGAMRR